MTLATCDSANVGGVVVPGASVAHDIHDGGVPLVVASQFPLSYRGSVVFVKRLYERLLGGDDPRYALRETRRAVFAAATRDVGPVDWGALVQYGALPHDLESLVYAARFGAVRQRIDAALSSADPLIIPEGRAGLATAWRRASEGLELLEPYRSDPEVDRYISRVHLRWGFILHGYDAADREAFKKTIQDAPELVGALWSSSALSFRSFREGLHRHYRVTANPVSLVEVMAGDLFLGEPLSFTHAMTAATQCLVSLEGSQSKERRRKLERALIYLWILAPSVAGDRLAELDEVTSRGAPGAWFVSVIDRQLADAAPTDFEYFASWRHCRCLADVAPTPMNSTASSTRERAERVMSYLGALGVRTQFSAVVDWIEQPDGGVRTVAT